MTIPAPMRTHVVRCYGLIAVTVAWTVTGIARRVDAADGVSARVIAGFGSSVCLGAGDECELGGYIGRLKSLLRPRGWHVVSVSRGGDDTLKIQQRWAPPSDAFPRFAPSNYLLTQRPRYVILGLSLNNDGIRRSADRDIERVCAQFQERLSALVDRCQTEHIQVIVAGCYAHNEFSPAHYAATKRTNLAMNKWDVPSINLLGTVDNGQGHWADRYFSDAGHPSAAGYQEMFYAIVPTLFDALAAGKPRPRMRSSKQFAAVNPPQNHCFEFNVTDPMHSFAMSCEVRLRGNGIVGRIIADQPTTSQLECAAGIQAQCLHGDDVTSLRVCRQLRASGGNITYRTLGSPNEQPDVQTVNDRWHWFTLSHCYARGETSLYVDGQLQEIVHERLVPIRFELATSATADYRNWMIHRSSLDDLQVGALHASQMVQSSLELYAPLDDSEFVIGRGIKNLAQSLSQAVVVCPIDTSTCIPIDVRRLHGGVSHHH